jgi:hypothetical protein
MAANSFAEKSPTLVEAEAKRVAASRCVTLKPQPEIISDNVKTVIFFIIIPNLFVLLGFDD